MDSNDTKQAGDDDHVYLPLEDGPYQKPGIHEGDKTAVSATLQHSSAHGAIGAKAIRWSWWISALVLSGALWLGIAKLLSLY